MYGIYALRLRFMYTFNKYALRKKNLKTDAQKYELNSNKVIKRIEFTM
jgi:hypothetical protein